MSSVSKSIKLTQYSHGAGCGCKIAPKVLDQILKHEQHQTSVFTNLLVGNEHRDDAAVLDLEDGTALISTTDFFMPIVDDAFDFGRIAAVNAISDVYAMGGTPLMAIAILGWPVDKLPAELAREVIQGGRRACAAAKIPLAGGHSIDSPEPIFGLAVSGRVPVAQLKTNAGAKAGCHLYLTKPLGVGILTTAQKKKKLQPEHQNIALDNMVKLNHEGAEFSKKDYVKSMTDVTGFGLLGHLIEMCEASNCSAVIEMKKVPVIDQTVINDYLRQNCVPGGTVRNWSSYGQKINDISLSQRQILCDPQTSGGLLVAVEASSKKDFEHLAASLGLNVKPFGVMEKKGPLVIRVIG